MYKQKRVANSQIGILLITVTVSLNHFDPLPTLPNLSNHSAPHNIE